MYTDVDFSGSWADICARYGLDPEHGYEYTLDSATDGPPRGLWYSWELSGADGAHYTLFREPHHTDEDVARAKARCREQFDVTGFSIIRVYWADQAEAA